MVYRYKHGQGHYIWLETTGKILLDHEGKVVGAVFSSRDITERKILEESQNSFFRLSIDMLGIANTKGYFVEINNAWETCLGWSVEELLSKPYLCFVHPEDRELTIKTADQLMKGGKAHSFINRYLCKDGSYKWISWNFSPDAEKALIYFVARDVTKQISEDEASKEKLDEIEAEIQRRTFDLMKINSELKNEINTRKTREKKLSELEEKLRLVTDNLSEVVWLRSPDNSRVLFVNPAFERIWGLTCEELYKNPMAFIETVYIEDRGRVFDEYSTYLENGKFESNYRIVRPCGEIRWVDVKSNMIRQSQGEVIGHVGSATDITDLKQYEIAITESEKFLRESQKVGGVGSYVVDVIGDTCQSSMELNEILGLDQKELHPLEVWPTLIHPEDRAVALSAHQESIRDIANFKQEYRINRLHDGAVRWISDVGELSLDISGKPSKIVGTIMDITERKLAEEEMNRQTKRAKAMLRIASHMNAELELDKLQKIICEEACNALRVQMSVYLRYDSNTRHFYLEASSGLSEEVARAFEGMSQDDIDVFFNKWGKSNAIPDLTVVSDEPFAQILLSHGIITSAYSLVQRDGLLLGILIIGDDKKAYLPDDAIATLSGLANQAALAITNAQLFSEAKNRLSQVQALRNIDLAITGSFDLRVTLQVVLDEVTSILNTDAAALLRLDPLTGTLEYKHWRGFRSIDLDRINIPLGEGCAGRAALSRKAVCIQDLREGQQVTTHVPFIIDEGFVAYSAVPLIAKGTVLGVLEVFHRSQLFSNGEWLALLETLAGQAAIAIDNAELFSQLERSNVDLLQAYDATIEGWAHALDLKDTETENHSQRVTELTLHLAGKMGIKGEDMAHIRRGTLLHDIGKMGIPDSILLKPSSLNKEEWEIMRKHPVYAFEMLSSIDYLRPALGIPYCHHERWDGSGYPRGLKGKQIPLEARIFAVVDVFDALTSDRPYRKAWTREKALEHMRGQSNKHFDPLVLDVFVQEIGHLVL